MYAFSTCLSACVFYVPACVFHLPACVCFYLPVYLSICLCFLPAYVCVFCLPACVSYLPACLRVFFLPVYLSTCLCFLSACEIKGYMAGKQVVDVVGGL